MKNNRSITVAEWRAFWLAMEENNEGDGYYYDSDDLNAGPSEEAKDSDVIEIPVAAIGWQGKGDPKPNKILKASDFDSSGDLHSLSLATAIKRWRKLQTTIVLSFEIPREREEEFKAAIVALGGKLL